MEGKLKSLRVEKKKGGLGFSIKGGLEHGIPIVVSEIHKNGPSDLHLGDELVYVNEASLQGASHSEAVQKLRNCKGPFVLLRVQSNRILEDTFLSPTKPHTITGIDNGIPGITTHDNWTIPDSNPKPLPQGWSRKVDYKSGKPYYENHLTGTNTWTDPRTIHLVPIDKFNWRDLPPGWERFSDQQGDIYYVNHDTQTTHWDSPRGMREQKQLEEIREFLNNNNTKLKKMLEDLTEKRTVLLRKNEELELIQEEETRMDGKQEDEGNMFEERSMEKKEELIEDIMILNEEIEEMDQIVTNKRINIKKLNDLLWKAQSEEIGDIDQYKSANELATKLRKLLIDLKAMETDTRQSVLTLEEIRGPEDTAITYMLQMTPGKEKRNNESNDEETVNGIHLLKDGITGKTNTEMRVEIHIINTAISHGSQLTKRAREVCQWVRDTKRGFDWDNVTDQLLGIDMTVFNSDWLRHDILKEKLELLME